MTYLLREPWACYCKGEIVELPPRLAEWLELRGTIRPEPIPNIEPPWGKCQPVYLGMPEMSQGEHER